VELASAARGIVERCIAWDGDPRSRLRADSNNRTVFRVDKQTDLLSQTGKAVEVGSPVCVLIVSK
jgi:hypothetical protein